jgi:hypothetical protein
MKMTGQIRVSAELPFVPAPRRIALEPEALGAFPLTRFLFISETFTFCYKNFVIEWNHSTQAPRTF